MSQGYTMIPTTSMPSHTTIMVPTLESHSPLPLTNNKRRLVTACNLKVGLHRSSSSRKREEKIGGRLFFFFFSLIDITMA